MRRFVAVVMSAAVASIIAFSIASRTMADEFSPYVKPDGSISLPKKFRTWAFLGTWVVASEKGADSASQLHNVYTQPETIEAYRKQGTFPDGAVIVKELLKTETGKMTTGQVSWAHEVTGWFVMIKDTKGRYADNKLWGDGWGWVLFSADNPTKPVTKNYKIECIPCHLPAKNNDWIYVRGYPDLKK